MIYCNKVLIAYIKGILERTTFMQMYLGTLPFSSFKRFWLALFFYATGEA